MTPMLNIATNAARLSGDLIAKYAERINELNTDETASNDFAAEVNKQANQIILDTLKSAYPDHEYVFNDTKALPDNEYVWLINSLDGKDNFLHGIPHIAISITLIHKNKLELALIYDPIQNNLFTATRGRGALLNNRRIRVSKKLSLQSAFLIGMDNDQNKALYLNAHNNLYKDTMAIRNSGTTSLDLAYVAAGRYDGYFGVGIHYTSASAGLLLVQEAGGLVGDFSGNHSNNTENIIAAGPKLFKSLTQKLYKL